MNKILAVMLVVACSSKSSPPPLDRHVGSGTVSGQETKVVQRKLHQEPPPATLKQPPPEAKKTASGISYLVTRAKPDGVQVKRNDTVLLNYTGWKQATGETFFTTKTKAQPLSVNLAVASPGLAEALPLFREGELGLVWMPDRAPTGLHGQPAVPEMLVYEVDLMKVSSAPEVPADVAAPPADAKVLAGPDLKYVELKAGKGKVKPRSYDNVVFRHTAWDGTGKMLETTEMRKTPAEAPPYRQAAVMEQVMTQMVEGQRIRFWVEGGRMAVDGNPPPGFPTGLLCYEVEIVGIGVSKHEPPPTPPVAELAKAPDDAKSTKHGVKYKILSGGDGNGQHPKPTDIVKTKFTFWRPSGRLGDSSALKADDGTTLMNLASVTAGLSEAVQALSPGQRARLWIPDILANKKAPARPQGDLVYDFELVSIKDPPH